MTELEIFACCAVLVAILFDIVTGFIAAFARKEVSSQVMREGFLHKFAIISLMALCIFLQISCQYLDLGFRPPMVNAAAAYLVLMEVASILENIGKMNPELMGNGLFKVLDQTK